MVQGERLEELARTLGEIPLEASSVPLFLEVVKRLHRLPPSPKRDGLLALAYLRLYQLRGLEEDFLRGYSYARTSRQEGVRRLAERLLEEG